MQIHEVIVSEHIRHEIDPKLGVIARKDQVLKQSSTACIAFDGVTYDVGPDGSFDLPEDVAKFYLSQPGWFSGSNPFAPEKPAHPARKRTSAKV